jgi:hypothetical protein
LSPGNKFAASWLLNAAFDPSTPDPSRFNTQGFVMTFSTQGQRRLIWHGMFLFLLGLIGFAEGQVINPRMGLAAHLEGLMNGTFLIALGGGVAVCEAVSGTHDRDIWMVLCGTYANVIITT